MTDNRALKMVSDVTGFPIMDLLGLRKGSADDEFYQKVLDAMLQTESQNGKDL